MINALIVRLKSFKLFVSMTVKTVKKKLVVHGTKYFGRKLARERPILESQRGALYVA